MPALASLEKRLLYDVYGKLLWRFRLQPSHAAHYLTGVFLPPHERLWLRIYFADYKSTDVLASRGTSKSYTHSSMAAVLKCSLYKGIATLVLSASGFRVGKELFKDSERMVRGELRSQRLPGDFLRQSISAPRIVARDPSIWTIPFRSTSRSSTAPTNNADQLRGLRATEVQIDERAFMDDVIPQQIIRPMLIVGQDFRRAATGGDKNKIVQVSTIDFTSRGWWKELEVATSLQRAEYDAWKARKRGDWDEHDRLMADNNGRLESASFSYSRVDYTDLIIPENIDTRDGQHRYKVNYPREKGISKSDLLKYDKRTQKTEYFTYPVDKAGLEQPLIDGTVDEDIWLAEQRNQPISTEGNVFPFELIQKIAERPIYTSKDSPKSKRKKVDDDDDDPTHEEYFAPLLYECGDPCILGVDIARESDDTAFTVIRIGELADAEFDPFMPQTDDRGRPVIGRTPWNHICWAESWPHLTHDTVALKIRDMFTRYNIINAPSRDSKFPMIGGIAMDLRGGGSAVRDELGNPRPRVEDGVADPNFDWDSVLKIYDPSDVNGYGHYAGLPNTTGYWSGLRLITSDNQDNLDWTFGMKGLMQRNKLFLAYWQSSSRWAAEKGLVGPNGSPERDHPEYQKWQVGYNGILKLKYQLLRIQKKVSEQGTTRFFMPGDRTKDKGKKDLWASSIYVTSLLREYVKEETKIGRTAPTAQPIVFFQGQQQQKRQTIILR